MKHILRIALLLITISGYAQTKPVEEIKISKAKLTSIISIKEIIADISADCLITTFECSANTKDGIATVTNNSDDINAITKTVFGTLAVKNKFYISNIKSNCPGKLKKEYGFVVTE